MNVIAQNTYTPISPPSEVSVGFGDVVEFGSVMVERQGTVLDRVDHGVVFGVTEQGAILAWNVGNVDVVLNNRIVRKIGEDLEAACAGRFRFERDRMVALKPIA